MVSSHRRFCTAYKTAPKDVFRKRRQDLQTIQAAEAAAARLRDSDVMDGAADAPNVQVEEPEVCSSAEVESLLPLIPHRQPIGESPSPPRQYRPSGLPDRIRKLPLRFRDELPPETVPVAPAIEPNVDPDIDPNQDDEHLRPEVLPDAPRRVIETQKNEFGVYRQYIGELPSYTPNDLSALSNLCNAPAQRQQNDEADAPSQPWWATYLRSADGDSSGKYYAPFPNPSTYLLMRWYLSLSTFKSLAELNRLVKDVFLSPDFKPEELHTFSADREAHRLDSHQDKNSAIFEGLDGWHTSPVTIRVPCEGVRHDSEDATPAYEVEGLYYRDIVEVIKSAFKEPSATRFHTTPYKEYFQPSDGRPPERLYSELYTADAILEEHEKIRAQPRNCDLETFVIPILIWSDSTHLASFGTASLWPMYLYIGNHTKYTRCKPSSFSAHHLAYMPKVCAFLFCWPVNTHYLFSSIPPSKTGTWKRTENPPLQSSSGSANANTSKPLCYYS